jgi:pSer/pThr/pTyr-binding forkhead associated (FHA) protein
VPQLVLTVLKYTFLALLYLFLARAVRVIYLDLVGPRVPRPAAKQKTRQVAEPPKKRKAEPKMLVVSEPDREDRTVPLNSEAVTIGRGESCVVVLGDNYASQFHARVYKEDGGWFVEDMGSTNGTYLNRVKVTEAIPLAVGDQIRIGKTTLEARR